MNRIQSVINFMKNRPKVSGLIFLIVVGIIYTFFGGSKSNTEIITVKRGSLVEQVSVSGKVTAISSADLGFDQSGRISLVRGKVGDIVQAGTVIASIENGDLRADVLRKQAALETARANFRQLQIGTRPEELSVTQASVDSARSALGDAKQGLVTAITNAYSVADDSIRTKIDLLYSNPRSSNPQINFTTSNFDLTVRVNSSRQKMETLLEGWSNAISGINTSSSLRDLAVLSQKNITAVNEFIDMISFVLASANPNQTVTQSTLDSFKTTVSTARTNTNTAASTLNTAVASEKSADAALTSAERTFALQKAGSTENDLSAQEATVKAAEADVLSAQARLAKTMVVAPFTGTITRLDVKVGEIVSPNTAKISLMGVGAFQIESYVPEVNISLVTVGNVADVTLDAYGEDQKFKAKVVSIDPAETIKDGVSTYKVTLQFLAQDERIRSGMTANVNIVTMEKPNTVSVPVGVLLKENGNTYVTVLRNGRNEKQKVVTGITTMLGQVEIISGLENGDQVLLDNSTK